MTRSLFTPSEPLVPCRPYQLEALERGRVAIAKGARSVLFCMPTGTGKTRTAVEAARLHVAMGGIVLAVAPRRELVAQLRTALERGGLEIEHNAFVRTIQELTMPGANIPRGSLVILDEARHYVADEWSCLDKALPDATFLGLDATPERGDGRGLGRSSGGIFDALITVITVKEAVEQGYLVPCEVIRPKEALGSDLAQDPVDAWLKYASELSTVIFCNSVKSAQEIAERINKTTGGTAAAVWGEMPTADRDRALADFAAGDLNVLTNMHLLTEGWDAPCTECVMLTGPCATAGGLLQRVGRGMRLFPGKKRMLLLDLPGVTHTHGEPDDERTWHLDGVACRRASAPEARFCPVCGGIVTTAECEQCGHKGEMRKRKPRVLGLPMDRFARQRGMSDEEKAKALAGYLHAANGMRRSRRWAFICFEHKYGKATPQIRTLANRIFAGK